MRSATPGNSPTNTFVDGSDFAGARDNNTNFLTALKLLDLSGGKSPGPLTPALAPQAGRGSEAESDGEGEAAPAVFQPLSQPPASRFGELQAKSEVGTTAIVSASSPTWPRAKTVKQDTVPYTIKQDAARARSSSPRPGLLADGTDWGLESVLDDVAADVAAAWTKTR
jgi:hypothetical protein